MRIKPFDFVGLIICYFSNPALPNAKYYLTEFRHWLLFRIPILISINHRFRWPITGSSRKSMWLRTCESNLYQIHHEIQYKPWKNVENGDLFHNLKIRSWKIGQTIIRVSQCFIWKGAKVSSLPLTTSFKLSKIQNFSET